MGIIVILGLLQQMEEAGAPPLNTLAPNEARQAAEGFAALAGEAEPVAETQEISIPVEGGEILVTLITPRGLYGVSGCLIYYHGGGWVIGDRASLSPACNAIASRGGCRVANVEYRLSPEPYEVPMIEYKREYIFLFTAVPSHNNQPVGAV